MLAIRYHQAGGPEVLIEEEIGRPGPGAGQMLVRVHAAGVNPVDAKIRSGRVRADLKAPLPRTAGFDFSGTVEELGEKTPLYIQGDDVYGRAPFGTDGSYAEFVVVRPEDVSKKPHTVDHVHAAAIPTAGLTAWQGLFESDGAPTMALAKGQTVLIHGGSGGVGSFAVQLAKYRGARVIATAGGGHEEFVRKLGADVVVDYRKQRFEDFASGVDGVLDLVGGETQARSLNVLRPGGVLVTTVGLTVAEQARARGLRAVELFAKTSSSVLAELAHLVDARILHVPVSEVFPLHRAREAHEKIETGHTQGKIVLELIR